MRIAVYPGSFNPVHKGHIRIARYLLQKEITDRVLIVPTGNYWDKQDLLPLKDRIAMLKIFEKDGIVVEEEANELPYTYQLMRELRKRYPDDELQLVLGADNLPRFDEWKNYKELLKYPFLLVRRNGIDIRKEMAELNKSDYHILLLKEMAVSSSYIREHLENYEEVRSMLDNRVWRYLKKLQAE
ncbi:MAG: nicotinate (nicotinamide) nucleotide adenylyltransferase [Erysipelotrichaceae bacterium]|nr:nicotinate (nicotinamide) nucleotide adenylyltransferase [Erysipelotrichaceae bacterium]